MMSSILPSEIAIYGTKPIDLFRQVCGSRVSSITTRKVGVVNWIPDRSSDGASFRFLFAHIPMCQANGQRWRTLMASVDSLMGSSSIEPTISKSVDGERRFMRYFHFLYHRDESIAQIRSQQKYPSGTRRPSHPLPPHPRRKNPPPRLRLRCRPRPAISPFPNLVLFFRSSTSCLFARVACRFNPPANQDTAFEVVC